MQRNQSIKNSLEYFSFSFGDSVVELYFCSPEIK